MVIPNVPFGIPLPADPDAPEPTKPKSRTTRFLASDIRPADSMDSFFLPTEVTNVPTVLAHLDREALLALARTKVFLSPAIPRDLPFHSRFQLSFATAIRDAKRTFITEHELVNMRWTVRFRDSTWFGWNSGGRIWARHERGGKMQLGDMLFHWRFLGDTEADTIRSNTGGFGKAEDPLRMTAERARWKNEDVLNRRRLVQVG